MVVFGWKTCAVNIIKEIIKRIKNSFNIGINLLDKYDTK